MTLKECKSIHSQSIKKYSPDTDDYLTTDDKKGGPIDPVIAFETAF